MPLSTTRQPPAHRHAEGGGDRARSLRYRSQSREGRRGTRARAKGRARRPFTSAGEAEAAAAAIPPSRRRRLTRPRPSQHAPRGSPSGQRCPDYNSRQAPRGALTIATAAPLPPARPPVLPLTVSGRCGEASSSSFSSVNMAGRRGEDSDTSGRGEAVRPPPSHLRACAERSRRAPPAGGAGSHGGRPSPLPSATRPGLGGCPALPCLSRCPGTGPGRPWRDLQHLPGQSVALRLGPAPRSPSAAMLPLRQPGEG